MLDAYVMGRTPLALPDLSRHEGLWATSLVVSVVLFVGGVFAATRLIVRLPEDFLEGQSPRASPLKKVLRSLLGVLLVAAGVVLLVLPGPGIVLILFGVSLLDFPGKEKLLRRVLSRPNVLAAINKERKKHGAPPLRPSATHLG